MRRRSRLAPLDRQSHQLGALCEAGGWGARRRSAPSRRAWAYCLLALGALTGWVLPHLNDWFPSLLDALPFARDALTPVAASGIDPAPIVGADLTTLAVIIAVLIGYNVAALQIAGQTLSLALTRAILLDDGAAAADLDRASPSSRWST